MGTAVGTGILLVQYVVSQTERRHRAGQMACYGGVASLEVIDYRPNIRVVSLPSDQVR